MQRRNWIGLGAMGSGKDTKASCASKRQSQDSDKPAHPHRITLDGGDGDLRHFFPGLAHAKTRACNVSPLNSRQAIVGPGLRIVQISAAYAAVSGSKRL